LNRMMELEKKRVSCHGIDATNIISSGNPASNMVDKVSKLDAR
jgi:hypothetical protein